MLQFKYENGVYRERERERVNSLQNQVIGLSNKLEKQNQKNRVIVGGLIGVVVVTFALITLNSTSAAPTAGTCLPITKGGTGVCSLAEVKDQILGSAYPVGSVFVSTSNVNPGTYMGFGTWEEFGQGRTLVGVNTVDGDFNLVNKEGGAKTSSTPSGGAGTGSTTANTTGGTAITVAQMPSHTHPTANSAHGFLTHTTSKVMYNTAGWSGLDSASGSYRQGAAIATGDFGQYVNTGNTGEGGTHNHTIPALTVSTPNHTHPAQSVVQPYVTVYFWKRTN
ncbi:hypothetical protein FACS189431_3550 [Alphaproteobacteria bacterium]|nr:hypothetical protein FACS189431_3550 [Alphaproteobacteria bacterium]